MLAAVWKGQLTFGLVSIPIRIVRAARQERVRFTHVYRPRPKQSEPPHSERPEHIWPEVEEPGAHTAKVQAIPVKQALASPATRPSPATKPDPAPEPPTVAPVRRAFTAQDTGETVAPEDVLKGYEYEKGQFAVFHPEEMRRFRAETTHDMEIVEFVRLDGIDPVYFNASYYVIPDRGGDKPYSLLFEAMRRTGYAALARLAMHGREQIDVLRSGERGIIMHTLFFETEIHAQDEFTANGSLVTAQEMKLAELLISQLAAEFDPSQFKDERMARIHESIEEKIGGGKTGAVEPPAAGRKAPVVDILDALRRSLERKPAAKEAGMKSPGGKKAPKHRKAGA